MNGEYSAKLEFEVNKLDQQKIDKLKNVLDQIKEVNSLKIDINNGKVYLNTTLPTTVIQQEIEKNLDTLAVLKGMGSGISDTMKHIDSAVAEVMCEDEGKLDVRGVIRFVQLDEEKCAIDGVIDGLSPGQHAINVHEFGDLTDGFNRIGKHFNPTNKKHGLKADEERHAGDLGDITANEDMRATFRIIDNQLKLWDIIGRSVCISEKPTSKNSDESGKKLACGIIARSSNVFQNVKKICLCSGKTLWDERWDAKRVNANKSKI